MLQRGKGYSITFNNGDYEEWSVEDKALVFYLVNDAWQKLCDIKQLQADPDYLLHETFRKLGRYI